MLKKIVIVRSASAIEVEEYAILVAINETTGATGAENSLRTYSA